MKIRYLPFAPLLAVVALALLFGCAQSPQRADSPAQTPAQIRQAEQAAAFEAQGNFTAAAAVYDKLAASTGSPLRDRWLLRAADARLQGNDVAGAEKILGQAQPAQLPPSDQLLRRLIAAEIHLARKQGGPAVKLLKSRPTASDPIDLRKRFSSVRAQALRLTGDRIGSAWELSQLDLLETKRVDRADNQLLLLRTLATLPDATLKRANRGERSTFDGWLDLTLILDTYLQSPQGAAPLLANWKKAYPNHPALPDLFKSYAAGGGLRPGTVENIAVLLPSSGRFAAAADVIKEGILTAYYAAPEANRPELRFYDSSDPTRIRGLVKKAVAEGAGAIIGPLQKPAVEKLTQGGIPAVPVLTLNWAPRITATPANLFQFGLAPEDEATQAADKARADGASTAMALVPQGEWGERLLRSFTARWTQLGGRISAQGTYDPTRNDFSGSLKKLLRQAGGAGNSAGNNALFLATTGDKARQLWPQVQFHTKADKPTYTTSHVFTGRFNHPEDLDLVGLQFSDIPWVLAPSGRGAVPPDQLTGQNSAVARLFALGMDSYLLLDKLSRMQASTSTRVAGATGDLYLDRNNRIHRRLMWARITAQGIQNLGFTPD